MLCPCFLAVQSERMRKTDYIAPGGGERRNIIEKPITLRQVAASGRNVIEKPTTLRRVALCVRNIIKKPITMFSGGDTGAERIRKLTLPPYQGYNLPDYQNSI